MPLVDLLFLSSTSHSSPQEQSQEPPAGMTAYRPLLVYYPKTSNLAVDGLAKAASSLLCLHPVLCLCAACTT